MTSSWSSPSNIALIKYWGKKGFQIPANPSLSLTLEHSRTTMSMQWEKSGIKTQDQISLDFSFEGKKRPDFEIKIIKYFNHLSEKWPQLLQYDLKIESSNSFPHSAGIASSASSMSALSLCLMDFFVATGAESLAQEKFFNMASNLARQGSGSACRSLFGGFVLWGEWPSVMNSHDGWACEVKQNIDEDFKNIGDAILIVSSEEKQLSSSQGHQLMSEHPFALARFKQARVEMAKLFSVLCDGNWIDFQKIVQHEALTLHALMMSSQNPTILLNPNTLKIIEVIENFERETKMPLAYTLDAGPNVHLLYPKRNKDKTIEFIQSQLLKLCENEKFIDDEV